MFKFEFPLSFYFDNQPEKKGCVQGQYLVKQNTRYCVRAIHTRFQSLTFFVFDAENNDICAQCEKLAELENVLNKILK